MMTSSPPAPLVYFQVLADQHGKPAALLLQWGADVAAPALAAFADSDALKELAAASPAFFRPDVDPSVAALLTAAGLRAAVSGAIFHENERLDRERLPAGTRYVAGTWYLAAPPKATGPQAASRALALQLVQLVANDADTHAIEALLRQDPTLSYHLLRLVNSLGMGLSRRITSFSQAILILGRSQLRRWLNLMLFAARQGDPRSAMLLARVAKRARAIELLARAAGLDKTAQEQGFMTGMFSLLGVLFGMPLSEVLAPLAIGDAVQGALLRGEGELGSLLQAIEAAEQGRFDDTSALLATLQVSHEDFNAAVIDATRWMLDTVRESQGGHA